VNEDLESAEEYTNRFTAQAENTPWRHAQRSAWAPRAAPGQARRVEAGIVLRAL
jgi:hypothetical protein